jgi:hypothetical protein
MIRRIPAPNRFRRRGKCLPAQIFQPALALGAGLAVVLHVSLQALLGAERRSAVPVANEPEFAAAELTCIAVGQWSRFHCQ